MDLQGDLAFQQEAVETQKEARSCMLYMGVELGAPLMKADDFTEEKNEMRLCD